MNDAELRARFAARGFVRLDRAFPVEAAAAMADAVWAELERTHGITRDRSTWTVAEPRGLGALRRNGAFDALDTPALGAAISGVLGDRGWPRPPDWGVPLVTFPGTGPWDVPTGGWHIDFPARGAPGRGLLVKWLAYLSPVAAGGGGTVVLAGSHRLVERFLRRSDPTEPARSPVVREAVFAADPWLRGIREPGRPHDRVERLMARGATVDGVDLQVVELTGRPGDVVLMHPRLFHAPAPNRGSWPRLMVTGGLVG